MADVVSLTGLDTGHCRHLESVMMQGGRLRVIDCHALVALLHHPREGWLLFDTGYAPRMLEVTQSLPFRLYRYATPLRIDPKLAVVAQLPRFGLTHRDIRSVILSHFHADHLCGLRDFPEARFIAHRDAWSDVRNLTGISALRRGFIPDLLPSDFGERLETPTAFRDEILHPFGFTHDLFGDGLLRLVGLPGHARGQVGLLVQTETGPVFLVADAAWMLEGIRTGRPPHPVTNAMVDDPKAVQETLVKLHAFHRASPETALIPTHCPEAYNLWVRNRR
jgi:glyoxylase-like metal-dependent hydrolase (beta-lactamase superfamily II)